MQPRHAACNDIFRCLCSVFTNDWSRAFRLMESSEAGMMGINDGVPTTSQVPFGGVKQSGWGRELGTEGMEAFLETKHVCLGLG